MTRTYRWVGGPLDGASETTDAPARSIWAGPDPAFPKLMVVVYLLYSDCVYRYDQAATMKANQKLRMQHRDSPSSPGGGSHDEDDGGNPRSD